jgi:hypothetical protein
MPPAASPTRVGLDAAGHAAGLVRHDEDTAVAMTIAIIIGRLTGIAEEDQPEDRDLDRLGLDVGDDDDE